MNCRGLLNCHGLNCHGLQPVDYLGPAEKVEVIRNFPIALSASAIWSSIRWVYRVAVKLLVRRACSKSKGCEGDLKSRRSRDDRNPIAESKGVCRETESEGS